MTLREVVTFVCRFMFFFMIVMGILAFLSGCGATAQGDFVRAQVENYGSKAYDKGLENSEFFLCRAASVGSVMRRYKGDDAKWLAWQEICGF